MDGIYNWIRKVAGHGWVICAFFGFLAGVACGRWMPDALVVAATLAVVSGFLAGDRTPVFESSMLFVGAGALGISMTIFRPGFDPPSVGLAKNLLLQTPTQIIWVTPLQILGCGLGVLLRRGRRQ